MSLVTTSQVTISLRLICAYALRGARFQTQRPSSCFNCQPTRISAASRSTSGTAVPAFHSGACLSRVPAHTAQLGEYRVLHEGISALLLARVDDFLIQPSADRLQAYSHYAPLA